MTKDIKEAAALLEQIMSDKKGTLVVSFAIEGLEDFAGVGRVELDFSASEEVRTLLAQHAGTSALIDFQKKLFELIDAYLEEKDDE